MQAWRVTWAQNLKTARMAKGWTQPAMAEHIPGITGKQISYFEMTGRISVEHLVPIARALGIPVEDLFPLPDVNGDDQAVA